MTLALRKSLRIPASELKRGMFIVIPPGEREILDVRSHESDDHLRISIQEPKLGHRIDIVYAKDAYVQVVAAQDGF